MSYYDEFYLDFHGSHALLIVFNDEMLKEYRFQLHSFFEKMYGIKFEDPNEKNI